MKLTYTKEIIGYMQFFVRSTGATAKDCFEEEGTFYFVVEPGQIGKAVGKNGMKIKEMQRRMRQKIKIVEYSPNLTQFIKNLIYPINADVFKGDDEIIILKSPDMEKRARLIGRNAKNLNRLKRAARRYFIVKDIKVE